jgi:hypothetical protein
VSNSTRSVHTPLFAHCSKSVNYFLRAIFRLPPPFCVRPCTRQAGLRCRNGNPSQPHASETLRRISTWPGGKYRCPPWLRIPCTIPGQGLPKILPAARKVENRPRTVRGLTFGAGNQKRALSRAMRPEADLLLPQAPRLTAPYCLTQGDRTRTPIARRRAYRSSVFPGRVNGSGNRPDTHGFGRGESGCPLHACRGHRRLGLPGHFIEAPTVVC